MKFCFCVPTKQHKKGNISKGYVREDYHWAICAPAAFLRTKSGLSLYRALSMGSETTPP